MDETNDSVCSNPEQLVNDDELLWLSRLAADCNENQGDHNPPPLQNSEVEGTSTSQLDREWGWLHQILQPAGNNSNNNNNNYNSSDCWSAASEAQSLDNFLPVSASDVVSPALLDVATVAEDGNFAATNNSLQELENLDMDHATLDDCFQLPVQLLSCDTNLLSRESDGEDEIQSESTVNLQEGSLKKVRPQTPEPGMAFSSEEEAYKFYKTYAKETGFSVRKGKVRRLSNGDIRKRFFFCSRQGFRSKNQSTKTTKYQRKETRTGCNAMVEFTVENQKWVISGFTPEHNHDLEGKSKLIAGSSNKISEDHSLSATVNKAGMLNEADAANSVVFHGINCSSFPHDEEKSCPKHVNGQSLINYFRQMQMEDPSFSYTVQVDTDNRLTNFFWTDGRSRMDYDYFGDVVILDKTFRIDAYNIIYAPFFGINHHRQYVLFGGAFLRDESNDSLIWLLRTFLDSMGRHQPKTIFTDGYQAIADAIELVLPKTHHLLDIWHVLRNAKTNLSKCYGQPGFYSLFKKSIFNCESEEEFESMWKSLLEQYDLCADQWLQTLYMLRRKWSHCFCKSIFSAGIRSIQCCHSIGQFLHSLTSKTMTPLQFVQHYLKVAEQQRREELREDVHSIESAPATILRNNAVEKEAAKIYSCTVFKLFQEELLACLSVAIEEIPGDGMTAKFRITEEDRMKEKMVEFNCVESHLTCSCKNYESVGILCVHSLKVLNAKNIFQIPPQYILKRWTKSAKDGMVADDHEGKFVDDSQGHLRLLKSKLTYKALNVITKSLAKAETGMIVEDYLNMALKKVEEVLRPKNIGCLNITDVDVAYKYDAADANRIMCVETQQIESNPSIANQQKASNPQMKRKRDNELRETKSMSSDGAITHRYSFRKLTTGIDCQGSERGPSHSYSVGGNSGQSVGISPRPPLPSQSTYNQFKDQSKSRGDVQLASQVRSEGMEKEISKLRQENQRICLSMHDKSSSNDKHKWKNLIIHQKILVQQQQQLETMRGDNSRVSVTVQSLAEQDPDAENFNGGSNSLCPK